MAAAGPDWLLVADEEPALPLKRFTFIGAKVHGPRVLCASRKVFTHRADVRRLHRLRFLSVLRAVAADGAREGFRRWRARPVCARLPNRAR